MSDPDATVPISKASLPMGKPSGVDVTDSCAERLLGDALGDSNSRINPHTWQPPSVEDLHRMLPQYEITALIARGGMGAVYKGTQKSLRRTVAIKLLPPEIEDGDLQFAARFKHEAQAMAQLSHPNIVAVFDAGETPEGLLYFVMEFIEGTDVAQLIASEGRLDPLRAIQITTAVCEALAFAHEEGIIHRDIKPSNIMLDKRGRVKVADFGLAKTANIDSALLTGSNVAMGTPDFIAPESLIAGLKVDQRADIYAVGVMLYQMLTGHIPRGRFELPSLAVPGLDYRLDHIVDHAMQTDREKRYSTAVEMKTDVERVIWGGGEGATNKKRGSARSVLILLALGAVALLAFGVVSFLKPEKNASAVTQPPALPSSKGREAAMAKAEAIWKARWHKPGKLRAAGTDAAGQPLDLKAAEPFADFVQVVALDPNTNQGKTWAALRSNGDLLWSDGGTKGPRIGLLALEGKVRGVFPGGMETPPDEGLTEPVSESTGTNASLLPGGPTVKAYADVEGTWHLESTAFEIGKIEKPDVTSLPKVTRIIVGQAGIGVLREDHTFRLWNSKEVSLPASVTKEIRDVLPVGNQWIFRKNSGTVVILNVSRQGPKGMELRTELTVQDSALVSGTAIVSGGYGGVVKRPGGIWATGFRGEVDDTLVKLHAENNESFSVFRGGGIAAIFWIEPVEPAHPQTSEVSEKSSAKR